MKKKILLQLFLISFLSLQAFAQGFTIHLEADTLRGLVNEELIFHFTLKNESNRDLVLYAKRVTNDLPQGWSSNFCMSACFSPRLDSIATNEDYGFEAVSPGSEVEIQVHVMASDVAGTGKVEIVFGDLEQKYQPQNFELIALVSTVDLNEIDVIQSEIKLFQNYPNPFHANTQISFDLPQAGKISLKVYDILGRKLLTLAQGYYQAGFHTIILDRNSLGSGVYFYQLSTSNITINRKMILEN